MSMREDLKAFLDGELDRTRSDEVKAALERDPNLRKEAEQLQAVSSAIRSHAAEIAPEGIERTLAALAKSKPRSRFVMPWGWAVAGALSTAVALIALLQLLPKSENDSAAPASVAMADKQGLFLDEKAPAVAKGQDKNSSANQAKALAPVQPPTAPRARVAAASPRAKTPGTSAAARGKIVTRVHTPVDGLVASRKDELKTTVTLSSAAKPIAGLKKTPTNLVVMAPMAEPAGTVVLTFATKEFGRKQVLDAVGKYAVADAPSVVGGAQRFAAGGFGGGRAAGDEEKPITVDLPEDQADKILADLKKLPSEPPPAATGTVTLGGPPPGSVDVKIASKAKPSRGLDVGPTTVQGGASSAGTARLPSGRGDRRATNKAKADSISDADAAKSAQAKTAQAKHVDGAVLKNAVESAGFRSPKPKMRRVLIVIEVKPKQQPVP